MVPFGLFLHAIGGFAAGMAKERDLPAATSTGHPAEFSFSTLLVGLSNYLANDHAPHSH